MAAFRGSNEREFADASLRSTMIGDYSAIGFGRSMTEAFDELRTEQDRIVKCLKATVRTFRKLKTRGEEEEEEEDEFKDLSESIATSRYCEDRERLMDSLRQWTFDSAFQIGDNFVDAEKDAERIQRILDFVNSAKTMLRATTPLGRQTEERTKDAQFLALFVSPEDILEMGRIVRKHIEDQARVLNDSKVTPKTGRGIGASTMMSGSAGYSLRTIKGRERGSASSTPAGEEMAPQGSSTPDLTYGKIKERREKHTKERKEKKMTAFRLEEEVKRASCQEGKSVGQPLFPLPTSLSFLSHIFALYLISIKVTNYLESVLFLYKQIPNNIFSINTLLAPFLSNNCQ